VNLNFIFADMYYAYFHLCARFSMLTIFSAYVSLSAQSVVFGSVFAKLCSILLFNLIAFVCLVWSFYLLQSLIAFRVGIEVYSRFGKRLLIKLLSRDVNSKIGMPTGCRVEAYKVV